MLFPQLPIEVNDRIMMYIDPIDILKIGKDNVSEFIWLCKKDRTLVDACVNNNLVGIKYLVTNKINASNDCYDYDSDGNEYYYEGESDFCIALRNSVSKGHLEILQYLNEYGTNILGECWYDANINNAFLFLYGIKSGCIEVFKYLVEKNILNINYIINTISTQHFLESNYNTDIVQYIIELKNQQLMNESTTDRTDRQTLY